jgi:hypothetical protein
MDHARFDDLARRLFAPTPTTRRRVAALIGTVVAGGAIASARPVAVGAICLADGQRCKSAGSCCSGICRRKGNRKRCKPAAGAQGCTTQLDTCGGGGAIVTCPLNANGMCLLTPNGQPFCATKTGGFCSACDSDADCEASLGAGARCLVCNTGCGLSTGGGFCSVPAA